MVIETYIMYVVAFLITVISLFLMAYLGICVAALWVAGKERKALIKELSERREAGE